MRDKAVMTAKNLIYKYYCYQDSVLEGNDTERVQSGYDRWSNWCVITAITPAYIRIELPDKNKSSQHPISYYNDYKVNQGYWLVYSDYGNDIDTFYYCRSSVQALVRKWLCRAKCSGPYLLHTINLED